MFFRRKKIEPIIEINKELPIELEEKPKIEVKDQRWHVKKRQPDGKFKGITTLDHLPSEKELGANGPGNYYIYTTKPHFSCVSKVLIAEYQERKPSKKLVEQKLNKFVVKHTPKAVSQLPDRGVLEEEPISEEVSIYESPAPRVKEIERKPEPVIKYQPIELPLCEWCNREIHYTSMSVTCYYCGQLLHSGCIDEHNCAVSFICKGCGERGRFDGSEQMPYCRKYFHSPQCIDVCFSNNKLKTECWGKCHGSTDLIDDEASKEDDEASEEDDEIKVFCMHCDTAIEHQKYIVECTDCEELFCSFPCGRNYHREQGERHHLQKIKFDTIEWE